MLLLNGTALVAPRSLVDIQSMHRPSPDKSGAYAQAVSPHACVVCCSRMPHLGLGSFTAPTCMCERRLCCAEISICEPDVRVSVETPSATPDDILYNQQWNMRAINAPGAWQTGQFGDPKQQVGDQSCC